MIKTHQEFRSQNYIGNWKGNPRFFFSATYKRTPHSFVLSSCAKGRLIKFSLKAQKAIKMNLRFSQFEVTSIAVCKKLKRLVTGDCEGKLKVLCSKTLKLQTNFGALHKNAIYSIALTSDEKYIFSSCVGNLIVFIINKLKYFIIITNTFCIDIKSQMHFYGHCFLSRNINLHYP